MMHDDYPATPDGWDLATSDARAHLAALADEINVSLAPVYARLEALQSIVDDAWEGYETERQRANAIVNATFQAMHNAEMERQRDFNAFVVSLLKLAATGDEDAVKAMLGERMVEDDESPGAD